MDSTDIPEGAKESVIDLVTMVVLRHEQYRQAVCDLQAVLMPTPIEVVLVKIGQEPPGL